MKNIKRIVAALLCITMLIPTQAILAASGQPEETLLIEEFDEETMPEPATEITELEVVATEPEELITELDQTQALEAQPEQSSHYQEIVSLDPLIPAEPMEWDGDLVIYWNPGGDGQINQEKIPATTSNASGSNASLGQIGSGSDHLDGLTPATAVQSLNTAVRRAEKLSRQMEVDVDNITISAMKPMVIPQGVMYTVRGRGVTLTAWADRADGSDLIFAIDGGQLTLTNLILEPHDGSTIAEDAEMIYIKSGSVQLGENVESYGSFVLDYQLEKKTWDWSTDAEAEASGSEADRYQAPIIELLKKFDAASSYVLDLRINNDLDNVTAVNALFSDTKSTEEFMESFTVIEAEDEWTVFVEERVGGVLRDTTDEDSEAASPAEATLSEGQMIRSAIHKQEDTTLTQKSLVAGRALRSGKVVYWNPGGEIEVDGVDDPFPAGNDSIYDGSKETAPVKSWYKARKQASGGTIICMQTIDLSTDVSDQMKFEEDGTYLDADGNYFLDGQLSSTVTLAAWERKPLPVLRIPDNTSVVLSNITMIGQVKGKNFTGSAMMLCEGGQLILEKNVVTDPGCIQVNLLKTNKSKEHPVQINSADVKINIYFGGINQNIGWRYQDVVIAGPQLISELGENGAGDKLLENVTLEKANVMTIDEPNIDDRGTSHFKWSLRKDTNEDLDGGVYPSHLELYTMFYFDTIYLDGIRGENENYGATCYYPVQTFSRAREILVTEMTKSLAARQEALDAGKDWSQIDIPAKIAICGTVTVYDIESWDIPSFTNVDGTPIKVEIVTHMDPYQFPPEDGGAITHTIPDTLIHVTGNAGNLTLGSGVFIRSIANKADIETNTIIVDDGATLRFRADAEVTGLTNSDLPESRTLGTHILVGKNSAAGVTSSGNVHMEASWTGSINSKQYGLKAYGSTSKVTMDAGQINNHLNKLSNTNTNNYSAGVYLHEATMIMNGGSISGNTSNLGGSGVYLDTAATLEMNKGVIEKNKALVVDKNGINILNQVAYGLGVYVSSGATFSMGIEGSVDHDDAKIVEHTADSQFQGIGVYVASGGTFLMNSGTIGKNKGRGTRTISSSASYNSFGGGVANFGTFTMKNGLITENGTSFSQSYTNCQGGGLYLYGTSQVISGGTISGNQTGTYYSNSYDNTAGGGIFLKTSATIENVLIEDNRSYYGAGIMVYHNNYINYKLTLNDCIIQNNIATNQNAATVPPENVTALGYGGGIYSNYSMIDIDQLVVDNNKAYYGGGAFFAGSSSVYKTNIKNSTIKNNLAKSGYGGGIYNATTIFLDDVNIEQNAATFGGGMYNGYMSYLNNVKFIKNTAVTTGGGLFSNSTTYLNDGLFEENHSDADGGGIATGSVFYSSDLKIINNTADNRGGGIYSGSTTHISDGTDPLIERSKISGNESAKGGGIYIYGGLMYLNIPAVMKNTATGEGAQGNNIYLSQMNSNVASIYLFDGIYQQPDEAVAGTYNIYMESLGNSNGFLAIDPKKAVVRGDDPIYFNDTNNYLVLLKEPNNPGNVLSPSDPFYPEPAVLPIDLNPQNFNSGSVVVKPANVRNITVTRPNPTNTGGLNYTIDLDSFNTNAATDDSILYIDGGLLPERTLYDSYMDALNNSLTNVVLVGQGIYVNGTDIKASDSNNGLKPSTAVKTFERAEELLREHTIAANGDVGDSLGFLPFIYVCGTVTLSTSDEWNVDYLEDIYFADSKYRQAEIAAGNQPELAQVKRFTSFLRAPLFKITGSGTTLTIPALIINGMSDSVVVNDQQSYSPIFEIKDATVVLKDKANIRNNYMNTIKIDGGKLFLSSETPDAADADGFKNRQVEVARGDGVQLSNGSTMQMDGYASVVFPNVPVAMTSPSSYDGTGSVGRGVIVETGSSLTMNNDSRIAYIGDLSVLPIATYVHGVVIGSTGAADAISSLTMNGASMISDCYSAIAMRNYNAAVTLNTNASFKDNGFGVYGYSRGRNGISLEFNGDSSIYNSYERGTTKVAQYGIYFRSQSATGTTDLIEIDFNGNSSIHDMFYQGFNSYSMRPEFKIKMDTTASIYLNGSDAFYYYSSYGPLTLDLLGDSSIYQNGGYGINLYNNANTAAVQINLSGTSKIRNNNNYGFNINSNTAPIDIVLAGTSSIQSNGSYGIYSNSSNSPISLKMYNGSSIQKHTYGIFSNYIYAGMDIEMHNDSFISDSTTAGIYMQYAGKYLNLTMTDQAWIGASATGSSQYGVYLYSYSSYGLVGDKTDAYKVTMSGAAMIGGDGAYNSTEAKRGHSNSGIYSGFPINLNMSGQSKITQNQTNGVQTRVYSASYAAYFPGDSKIIMSGDATISDSAYGIYGYDKKATDGTYPIKEQIELSGQAKIINTINGNQFLSETTLSVLGNAKIDKPSSTNVGIYPVKLNGALTLDGTATIDGIIYLMDGRKAITLLSPIPASDPTQKYRLHLAEGYVGEVVVQPGGSLTDVVGYFDYFIKEMADGLASDKLLVKDTPNIILAGENNVYLSVNGKDSNNGVTPATAVRTFTRARQLLETGYFTQGANIIICSGTTAVTGTPIIVLAGDEDWSFDEGGYVQNTHPNSGQRWKPLVTRHETYLGTMIQLSGGTTSSNSPTASSVTFKDITIDGIALQTIFVGSRNYEKPILKVFKGEATIGKGAVFQNNRTNQNNSAIATADFLVMGVLVHADGTLIMDGGKITGMEVQNMYNSSSYSNAVAVLNLGKFEFKDGFIENNKVTFRPYMTTYYFDTSVILNSGNSVFTMTGGTIQDNDLDLSAFNNAFGSAIGFKMNAAGYIKGGQITNNKGGKGSAIYYLSTKELELEGGRIRGNSSYYSSASIGVNAPIYVGAPLFWLRGGGSIIEDGMYLDSTKNIISVRGNIYQPNRKYIVYLKQGTGTVDFKKGSVVVQPDGDLMQDASQFLVNFDVRSNPYFLDRGQSATKTGGTVGVKENQCLLLMQAVYIDSKNGSNSNNGSTPKNAVATFEQAKGIGEGTDKTSATRDYFAIFISGPIYPADGEVWNLENTSYMSRYTGYAVYDSTGNLVTEPLRAHYTYLIEPQKGFTLGKIRIYGRRVIDDSSKVGDSMVRIKKDSNVTMSPDTLLSRNYNHGSYMGEEGLLVALGMKGGAVRVEAGGSLVINGSTISETKDQFDTAIYQMAKEELGSTEIGQVKLDKSTYIEGGIYLEGKIDHAQAYLTVTEDYSPRSLTTAQVKLRVRLANDYSGRPVIFYQNNHVATAEQIDYFELDDSITAIYDLNHRIAEESMLELRLRQVLYVDGQSGLDSQSGSSPEDALGSLEGAYKKIKQMGDSSGALIFIVDTIDVERNITLTNERYKQNGQIYYRGQYIETDSSGMEIANVKISSQIYLKRYSKPDETTMSGFNKQTHKGSLFNIEHSGKLNLNGMFLDGHSEKSVASSDYLCAPSVDAESPLIVVHAGGKLDAGSKTSETIMGDGTTAAQTGLPTKTLISNNINIHVKPNILGQNEQGFDVYEGSSAGIEILSNGTDKGSALLREVEFKNLVLGNGVNGGSDVYQNGELIVQEETMFTGSVLLEGLGSAANPATSRYITVGLYGTPFKANFNVLLRDPYNTRAVVVYPNDIQAPNGPPNADIGFYLLEEKVNRYYALQKRATQMYVLELTVPKAVYLDGTNGNDQDNSGYAPNIPVKTLKKAYERLRESGGKVIYIVGTVDITESTELSATTYSSGGQTVNLFVSTDHVDIRRFVKPLAGQSGTANNPYNVEDFKGVLFNVKQGAILTLKENLYVDGHYSEKTDPEYTSEFYVDRTVEVLSPLIQVETGGTLKLQEGSRLSDNHNTLTPSGTQTQIPGGAINNKGTVELSGGIIDDNAAQQGAGIYQDGIFEIINNPAGIVNQNIYLATENTGTVEEPIWGQDRVINTAVLLPSTLVLDLQMDHAVAGRPVVQYTADNGVDSQYINYELGDTVPISLYLVERGDHDNVVANDALLELQDWRVLDITVPKEIFLVIQQTRTGDIHASSADTDDVMLASPEFTVKNNGRYDAKVSLSGFINQHTEAGITNVDPMRLVASPSDAVSASAKRTDLYLAITHANDTDKFAGLPETSLYDFDIDGDKMQEMGLLLSGEEADFIFVAAASRRFMTYYADLAFPFFGSSITAADRIAHIRNYNTVTGETSPNNARTKYKMTYRVEIMPPRR